MFLLKKLVSGLLFPLPVVTVLLVAGGVLLWLPGRQRWGRILTTLGVVLLLLCALRPLPYAGLRALERAYPPPDAAAPAAVRWIVVLGGGTSDDPTLPPNAQLTRASLARVVEGVRLLARYPEARLLLAGGRVFSAVSEASVMARTARLLQVDPARVQVEEASQDTHDQSILVGRIVGQDTFLLVTSASHMRRAVALFEGQGLHPIPAPTDYQVRGAPPFNLTMLYPSVEHLAAATILVREHLGYLWARLRGQL